jgi:hypothetical protein
MRGDKIINWGTPTYHQRNRTPRVLKKVTPKRLRKCKVTKGEHDFKLIRAEQDAHQWMTRGKPYTINTADYRCPCGKKMFTSVKVDRETGTEFDRWCA